MQPIDSRLVLNLVAAGAQLTARYGQTCSAS
jgi:hypothetical protein